MGGPVGAACVDGGLVAGDWLGRRRERMRVHGDTLPPRGPHEQHLEAPHSPIVAEEDLDGVPPQRVYQRCVGNGLVPLAREECRRAGRDRRIDERAQRFY